MCNNSNWMFWQVNGSYGAKYSKAHLFTEYEQTLCGHWPNKEYCTALIKSSGYQSRCKKCQKIAKKREL